MKVLFSILINLFVIKCIVENHNNNNYDISDHIIRESYSIKYRSMEQAKPFIILPLEKYKGHFYINASIGTPGELIKLMLDTGSFHSYILNRKSNGTSLYTNSTSYSSYLKYEKISKFYYEKEEKLIQVKSGNLSFDSLMFNNALSNSPNIENLKISKFGFILTDSYNNSSINQPENFGGTLTLARDNTYKCGEQCSITKQLFEKDLIQEQDFTIVQNTREGTIKISNYTTPFLHFGKLNTLSSKFTSCNLFQYDNKLNQLYACNISHLFIVKNNPEENIIDKFREESIIINSYALFDTSVGGILIPSNTKIIKNNELKNNNLTESITKKEVNIVDFFNEKFRKISNQISCEFYDVNSVNYTTPFMLNRLEGLESFVCYSTIEKQDEFIRYLSDTFEPNIYIVLNGYGYKLNIAELFTQEQVSNSDKKFKYYFNLMFYEPNENDYSFWVFGSLFLNLFDAVTFRSSEILFYGLNPLNLTAYTKDEGEKEPIISFFFVSLICVLLLIIIILLIPYLIYRQRKRAMMEKLQYDVIYKKMDDITKGLL